MESHLACAHPSNTAYADNFAGYDNGTWYEGIMDYFYNEIQSYSAYIPYMMSPGNHVGAITHIYCTHM